MHPNDLNEAPVQLTDKVLFGYLSMQNSGLAKHGALEVLSLIPLRFDPGI
jgi:hypothetical protein